MKYDSLQLGLNDVNQKCAERVDNCIPNTTLSNNISFRYIAINQTWCERFNHVTTESTISRKTSYISNCNIRINDLYMFFITSCEYTSITMKEIGIKHKITNIDEHIVNIRKFH